VVSCSSCGLQDPGPTGKPYTARYIGSLVGDFHRTMLYGGIYGYPRTLRTRRQAAAADRVRAHELPGRASRGKGSDGYKRVLGSALRR